MTARTEELKALTRRQPVENLAIALTALNDSTEEWDEAARLTRAVLVDVLIEKSPAAKARFFELTESDLECGEVDALMVAAALEEGTEAGR
jgi:hypothetical protein